MKKRASEFVEKQFELAFAAELATGTECYFDPGQVLEHLLGFDAAVHRPAAHIWSAIGVQAKVGILPRRLRLYPAHLRRKLPPYTVSVFLQYKRCFYQAGVGAAHYSYWKQPYYEFSLSLGQKKKLERLEGTVRRHAVVRYCAPVFWLSDELFNHQLLRSVVANSTFCRPSEVSGQHTRWTYCQPGKKGRANPEPLETEADDWSQLAATLVQRSESLSLGAHVVDLAKQLDEADFPRSKYFVDLAALGIPPARQEYLQAFIRVALAARYASAAWGVFAFSNLRPDALATSPDEESWMPYFE